MICYFKGNCPDFYGTSIGMANGSLFIIHGQIKGNIKTLCNCFKFNPGLNNLHDGKPFLNMMLQNIGRHFNLTGHIIMTLSLAQGRIFFRVPDLRFSKQSVVYINSND